MRINALTFTILILILATTTGCTRSAHEPRRESSYAPRPRSEMRTEMAMWRLKSYVDSNGEIPINAFSQTLPPPSENGAGSGGLDSANWQALGPADTFGGRVRSINFDPDESGKMVVGSVSGGMWISTNFGSTWSPVNGQLSNLAVTTIVRDPIRPTHLYAGTGELFLGPLERGIRGSGIRGAGVFKSTDDGLTWSPLMPTSQVGIAVNRLAISIDGTTLLAGTKDGLFRSTNFGATWVKVFGAEQSIPNPNAPPQSPPNDEFDRAAVFDVKFHPRDPMRAVASYIQFIRAYRFRSGAWVRVPFFQSGVAVTSDGGASWVRSSSGSGITENDFRSFRIELFYHGGGGTDRTVYALREDRDPVTPATLKISLDGGLTFASIGGAGVQDNTQGWYNLALWVDPRDSDGNQGNDRIVMGAVKLARSLDGGSNFTIIGDDVMPNSVHDDHHMIAELPTGWVLPVEWSDPLIFCTDGGVYVNTNISVAQPSIGWAALNTGLQITQFYGADHSWISNKTIGGTQDNGSLMRGNTSPQWGGTTWSQLQSGDGSFAVLSRDDVDHYYQLQFLDIFHRNSLTGDTKQIGPNDPAAPVRCQMVADPANDNLIYAAGSQLWKYDRRHALHPDPSGWTSIKPALPGANPLTSPNVLVSALTVSGQDNQQIWVGHEDGALFMTRNAGGAWIEIQGPNTAHVPTPRRFMTSITTDPNDVNVVYMTYGGYIHGRTNTSNCWKGVFTPLNPGPGFWTWSWLPGLPPIPIRDIEVHPSNSSILYAGTEEGLLVSEDGGQVWSTVPIGSINVSIDDLFWSGNELYVVTHGRGIFRQRPAGPISGTIGPRCIAIQGSGGSDTDAPRLRATIPRLGQTMNFHASRGIPNTSAALMFSTTSSPAQAAPGCFILTAPVGGTSLGTVTFNANGTATWPLTLPTDPALTGTQWAAQVSNCDASTGSCYFSNGVLMTFDF